MTPTPKTIIAKLLPIEVAKTTGGLFLPKAPEKIYEVLQVGSGITTVKPGDVIKPFKYCEPRAYEHEGETLYILKYDEFDDIVSRAG